MVAPVPKTDDTLLTVKDCAARKNISPSTVYSALLSGHLPGYRFGRAGKRGTWRVAAHELERWAESLRAGASVLPPPRAPARSAGRPAGLFKHLRP